MYGSNPYQPYAPPTYGPSSPTGYGAPDDSLTALLMQFGGQANRNPGAMPYGASSPQFPEPLYAGGQQQGGMGGVGDLRSMYSNASNANDVYAYFNNGQGFMPSTNTGLFSGPGEMMGAGGMFSSGSLGSAGSGLGMGAAEFGGAYGTGGAGFGIGEAAAPAAAGGASKGGAGGAGGAAGAGAGMSAAGFGAMAAIPLIAWLDQTRKDKQSDARSAHYRTPEGQQELANMQKLQSDHEAQMQRAAEWQRSQPGYVDQDEYFAALNRM